MSSKPLALTVCAGACAILLMACGKDNASHLTSYVDPKIGSGAHGHVFVGASVPFGMVQLGPTSIPQEWDWTSGYHDSDSSVIGFSHTHLHGTGIGDLFDITVMPVTSTDITYARGSHSDYSTGIWSLADRATEVAQPGYYAVDLERYGVRAELTSTERVGIHRYTFSSPDSAAIVIDLLNGGCWDRPTDFDIISDGPTTFSGHRFSSGWADNQRVFFAAELSVPYDSLTRHGAADGYARLWLNNDTASQVMLKLAISPVSVENARLNLAAEAPHWQFDRYRDDADAKWEKELAKVSIETTDTTELRKFYTAMYHTMIEPALFSDVNAPVTSYTTLSLWDTYRAEMPWLTIVNPQLAADITNTMLDIFDNQNRLPVWHLWGCETDCMVGNPGIIAVADAVTKKLPGVDAMRAMRAMLATAADTLRGGALRQQYGFIPVDLFNEAVAYDMEYAIADAAIANAATSMGLDSIANVYHQRSLSYHNYFDPSTQFIRGKDSKGEWRTPFNPVTADHRANDYCEGNAWQYTWLAPHDVEGLMGLFGSRDNMEARLDSLFIASSYLGENASPDISGMIGQYAHGNEPSHHIAYIYAMIGAPEKTYQLVDNILTNLYTDAPDGLSGNEDAGQMSAWYIMSALGFYEVEPASGKYVLGMPRYSRSSIEVPGGTFTITAEGFNPSRSVKAILLNGDILNRNYITHSEIMDGGELVYLFE